jgi:hypothetical protein
MRHLLCLQIIFIGISFSAKAQLKELYLESHDAKRFYFGIHLSYNRSNFHMNSHPKFLRSDSIMVAEGLTNGGIGMGIMANFRLSEHWEIRSIPFNLVFSGRTIAYNNTYPDLGGGELPKQQKPIESITYSLPIHVKFNSDRINNFRVYMFAGGKIEYDFASNSGNRNAEKLVKLTKSDYGVEVGLGFNFYRPAFIFSPEIKVSNGLSNRHSYDPNLKFSNVIDRISTRQITFSINLEGVID